MKHAVLIFITSALILLFMSCKRVHDDQNNFYITEYRIGRWISADKRDTLEFVNDSNLIRKGYFYGYESYLYHIDGTKLFIRLPSSSVETQHSILKAESGYVLLGNMYLTMGFSDNSGIFFKEKK